tara:strand:+ start:718 stop:828 length:111 start_codon:yes stop_codon:yes gene_type:complete
MIKKIIIIFVLVILAACAAPKECCPHDKDIIHNGKN